MSVFGKYSSGTYPNSWVVVNYNLYKPGAGLPGNPSLPANTVSLLETAPGYLFTYDVTSIVQVGMGA
jgi:hypothetical protein